MSLKRIWDSVAEFSFGRKDFTRKTKADVARQVADEMMRFSHSPIYSLAEACFQQGMHSAFSNDSHRHQKVMQLVPTIQSAVANAVYALLHQKYGSDGLFRVNYRYIPKDKRFQLRLDMRSAISDVLGVISNVLNASTNVDAKLRVVKKVIYDSIVCNQAVRATIHLAHKPSDKELLSQLKDISVKTSTAINAVAAKRHVGSRNPA